MRSGCTSLRRWSRRTPFGGGGSSLRDFRLAWLTIVALIQLVLTGGIAAQTTPPAGNVVDAATLQARCESGSGQACLDLALRYENGTGGVERNLNTGDKLFQAGCERGSMRACIDVGNMLVWGRGVKRDWAGALALFQKACDGHESGGCANFKILQSIVAADFELRKKANGDCSRLLTLAEPALYSFFPQPDAATKDLYGAIVFCGIARTHFVSVVSAGERQLAAGKDFVTLPWALPAAYANLGDYDNERRSQAALARLFPGEGGLTVVEATLSLRAEKDVDAVEKATRALAATPRDNVSKAFTSGLAYATRARALIRLNRLQEAERDIDALAASSATAEWGRDLRKLLVMARQRGFTVEMVAQTEIPLRTYHLLGNTQDAVGGWLVHLRLGNIEPADRELVVEVSIPGVSQVFKRDIILLKGGSEHLYVTPPLSVAFDRRSVVDLQPVEIDVRISQRTRDGDRLLYEESTPAKLLGFDYLQLRQRVAEDAYRPTYWLIAAWITPNISQVDALLAAAKKRAPGQTFEGEQGPTIPQVRALWDELQARGVSYVTDPAVGSTVANYQRVRFPSEVLESTNAECLEGAILFATLLEAIGLRPVIAVIPGHAFVGWRAGARDGDAAGKTFYVETTVVHTKRFEDAVEIARQEYEEQLRLGNFTNGHSRLLDIRALERQGITSAAVR